MTCDSIATPPSSFRPLSPPLSGNMRRAAPPAKIAPRMWGCVVIELCVRRCVGCRQACCPAVPSPHYTALVMGRGGNQRAQLGLALGPQEDRRHPVKHRGISPSKRGKLHDLELDVVCRPIRDRATACHPFGKSRCNGVSEPVLGVPSIIAGRSSVRHVPLGTSFHSSPS